MAHDPAKVDARSVRGHPCQVDAGLGIANARAVHLGVYLYHNAYLHPVLLGYLGYLPDVVGVVGGHHHLGPLGQGAQPDDLVPGDDLVGNENVVYTALHHNLGLGDLGRADAAYGAACAYLHVG